MKDEEFNKMSVYGVFDTNGIRVKPIDRLKIPVANYQSVVQRPSFESLLVPYLDGINISESDLENIIYEYIYDTVGLKIKSIEELKNHPSINGLPFILTLNEWSLENMAFCFAIKNVP